MEPDFLGLDELVAIHRDQVERYGGTPGVRDFRLLQSAASMPAATFGDQYLHSDLWEMAAAYLFHITQNHPFIDGNKRVGAVAADVFLALNGLRLSASEADYEELVWSVARGEASKSTIAEFFRGNTTPFD
ncbi:MAG: type II toxin-antitoxin system death-on-curing family toxin [Planctomycetes bacterium]|nr:type II toxin-antitoxin system death-on-curing family toxin [Planctomycetota bacterium]